MSHTPSTPNHFETCGVRMELSDLDFLSDIAPFDILSNEEENIQLSQIADMIEQNYIKEETMVSDFSELNFSHDYEYSDMHMDIVVEQTPGEVKTDLVKNPARFGKPVDDGDLNKLISDAIPPNTKKSTSWAMKVFDEWRKSRKENGEVIPELAVFTVEDVNPLAYTIHCGS